MEAELGSSAEVKFLLGITALAAFWMFLWKTKIERRATRLIKWVWENHPETWAALPWIYRNVLREHGLAELARRKAIADAHFLTEIEAIQPSRQHIMAAGAVAAVCILLIVAGTELFGWRF